MSEDAKVKATLDGRGERSDAAPKPAEPPLATMQMPRGFERVGEVAFEGAAPVMPTMVPNTGAAIPQSAPPAMPSDTRYEISHEIARGGMGRVVEATDTVLGRTVALKEALSLDPDSLQRFQRETRITARLEHPSIVPVHDAGISPNGSPYYVMRKVSGRPLEELVARAPELADRLALLPHIVATTHAVAHAHSRGIVHRDIKPSNILVGDVGETMVIDWGLAKAIGEPDVVRAPTAPPVHDIEDSVRTRAGIVFGTPGFMSPEQLRGAPVDERCDVYALGATLYHLLVRKPPHHNKNADEMLKAAVAGPPTPIRDLVPGVPPELATIIDKALAHDPKTRYQDAGALAEDLQRFLTGQLVASHHYSRNERFVRFIRKNRVPVAVAGAAALAMLVGAWLAIGRIVHERDRADGQARLAMAEKHVAEQQRLEAIAHADQLTLTQARHNADVDPTLAVAMVKPLAGKLWRSVRAIASAARVSGIAFSMPGSARTASLEISRDGQRVLAAGHDGIVRLYDLKNRTNRMVADAKTSAMARFADGERRFVVFHGTILTIIDAATGAHRDVVAPTEITRLAVSGPIAYWIDPVGVVWTLDLAATKPLKLALDEAIRSIIPSPDGRWVALAGSAHLMLVDRTQTSLPPEAIFDGETRDLSWAADASHLAALIDQEVVDIAIMPSRTVVQRQTVGNRNAVAYHGGQLVTAGPTGIAFVTRDESRVRRELGDFTLGVHEAPGGAVVTGGPQGLIKVLSEDGDYTLHSPIARLTQIEASTHSPWVVAATDGMLLVWDLEAVQPRRVTDATPSGIGFLTSDQLIVAFSDAHAQRIDLASGKSSSLGAIIPGLLAVVPAPDHLRAVAIDGTHRARLVASVGELVDLEDDIDHASFIDDHRLILATSKGALELRDHDRETTVVERGAKIVALATSSTGWVAAATERALWRQKLGGREAVLEIASPPPRGGMVVTSDGTTMFATAGELRAWRADGTVSTIAMFDKPIVSITLVDATRLLVLVADGNLSFVTLDGGRSDSQRTVAATSSISSDGLIASLSPAGVLEVLDPIVNQQWILANPKSEQAFSFAQLSPDSRRIVAATPQGLLVWTLGLPQTADDTGRWLDSLTNAISDDGRTLTWK